MLLALRLAAFLPALAWGAGNPSFKKVMIVMLENTNYEEALAQPFLSSFAKSGALLTQYYAATHPSQPNYIALVSGSYDGAGTDRPVDLDRRHIGDLLEEHGRSWKVYAEGYPGGCFLGAKKGRYVRRHVPFLSFKNVQKDPARCARIVDASLLKEDAAAGLLPDYALYIPDLDDDGHDTGAAYADRWAARVLGPLAADPAFMKDLLLVITFDEDDYNSNRIYAALAGPSVLPGAVSGQKTGHYGLLRTIEDAWGLGTLGRNDDWARPIDGVWR